MAQHPVTQPSERDLSTQTGDVQGIVLQGYGKLRAATYLLLRITDESLARAWLTDLVDQVTFGSARPPAGAVNVAFTAAGMAALGLPHSTISGFSPEFCEGMTSTHRSRLLGDVGDAAPAYWTWGGPDTAQVHAVLLLFAPDQQALDATVTRHRERFEGQGMAEVATLETRDIGFHEHFGFRDGLSQPKLAGTGPDDPLHTVALGEFLLGHLNGHGQYPRSPLVPAGLDPGDLLPRRPDGPADAVAPATPALEDGHDFGADGSYLVLRTLQQNVGGFWRYLDQLARRPDGPADPAARTALGARLVGRWPSGAPLTRSPDVDRPDLATDNRFGYYAQDRAGTRCPIAAHVRRTNPRDSLPPKPGTSTSVDVAKRHRLIRRGRSYGPRIEPEESLTENPETAPERGLQFLALCADIARQFEFVTYTWTMNPNFGGLFNDADPLLGRHNDTGTSFTIQAHPVRRRLNDLPVVVTPRGGAYFFLPSRRALRYVARP